VFLSVWPFRQRRNPPRSSRDPAEPELNRHALNQREALLYEFLRPYWLDRARCVRISALMAFLMLATVIVLSCLGFETVGLVFVFTPISAICIAMLRSARLPDELRSPDPPSSPPIKSSDTPP
jgi:hypothetical protein